LNGIGLWKVGVHKGCEQAENDDVPQGFGFSECPLSLFLFSTEIPDEVPQEVNPRQDKPREIPPMKVYPKKHDEGQQVQTADSIVLVRIEKMVPDHHEKQRENMRPGQPVDLGGCQREQNDQNINNDVPLVDTHGPEQESVCQGYQKGKKNHHTRESGNPVKSRHDDLGEPLVGRPGERRGVVGEDIVFRNRVVLQDIFSRPDVISRVGVGKQFFPRGGKHQDEKDYEEEELADRGNDVVRFSLHATDSLDLVRITTGR
jgi:hypothetical protein